MTSRLLSCLAATALVALSTSAAPVHASTAATTPLRRFALVIGSNNGGSVRERLRYAAHDAETIADVLRQLGGVDQVDLSLLSEPDRRDLDRAFDALSERVRAEHKRGQRVELVVYYSGHADESGILVGGEHYDYARLRQRIHDVPADVHIAIVDSCASGSFTRMKGGARMPAFLRDSSNQVQGFAFLSSSSADEDAQESDRIGASFCSRSPWYRRIAASFGGGLRVERPDTAKDFDALITLGGTSREVHGSPVIGVAETGDLSLGATLGNKVGFAYDLSFGIGPGVFLGDNLQVGATIGLGFSGITGGVLDFAWKIPTEGFVILELSPELRPMAYFRQDYLFGADSRKNGSRLARWGDEAEAGAGLRFSGRLDGFFYGSVRVREMAGVRYWGIGMGAIL